MSYKISTIEVNSTFTSGTNTFTVRLPNGFNIPKNSEVALQSAFLYYSWFNIDQRYGNQTFGYVWIDGTPITITLPAGFYLTSDINAILQKRMRDEGHYLLDNTGTERYYLSIATNRTYYANTIVALALPATLPSGWSYGTGSSPAWTTIAQTPGLNVFQLSKILGFFPGVYPSVPQSTDYFINSTITPIAHPVTNVKINCDLVSNSNLINNQRTVYVFTPRVQFGSQIEIAPQNLVWYNCVDSYINSVEVSLTDQTGAPLDLKDTSSVVFYLLVKSPRP